MAGRGRPVDEPSAGALYAWSTFVLPLEKEFGWTRTETSWVFTIAGIIGPIIAGRLFDIFGNYTNAFYVGSAICAAALGSLFLAKRPGVPVPERLASAERKAA